jgi:uncharacterized protein (TIGR02186 family)
MIIQSKLFYYFFLCSFVFLNYDNYPSQPDGVITNASVSPNNIEVNTFFDGTQIVVKAVIARCDNVIIKLEGIDEDMVLNRKAQKVIIWLNVAQVTVKNAPRIYILSCSDKLGNICSNNEQENELLGYNSLKKKIIFESTERLTGIEFEEFIKLKENSGSYKILNNIVMKKDQDGNNILDTTLDIPSTIPSGKYQVIIYSFKDRFLIDKSILDFSVKKVGLPNLITNLSKGSPAFYGILAILLAMSAGIVIGLIFTKKKSNAH